MRRPSDIDGGQCQAYSLVTWLVRAVAIAFAIASWSPAAVAQTATPDGVEAFKDWELFCPEQKPKDKPRVCEIRTVIKNKDGGRLGALAVAVSPEPGKSGENMIATALLPLGVDLTMVPGLKVGENEPMALQFRRCLQRGCEAVGVLGAEQQAALRSGTIAKVAVGIGGGKTAIFEFSLNGFTAAHDAMKKRVGKS